MTEEQLRELRRHTHCALEGWAEDGGIMIPTEPDPHAREMIRRDLKIALRVITLVLEDPTTTPR
jgi:hypothetical protein